MATLLAIARLQNLIWVLIYGGLLTLVLGIAVRRTDASLGLKLMIAGMVLAAAGAVLIYVRSRVKDAP